MLVTVMYQIVESLRLGFIARFLRLAGPFWNSEERWSVRALTLALILLTVAQIVLQVRINLWSANLFNALDHRSMAQFFQQLEILGMILVASMTINATHMLIKRRIQLMWRRWMTQKLLNQWVTRGHEIQITYIPGDHDNPDGRIAEDIRNTVESALELAHSLFYCLMLLISFIDILWGLSGILTIRLLVVDIPIPGHMVWIALVYSICATALALIVGWPLIRAADRRQTAEANFRFGLVHVRENAEAIALVHGELDERNRLNTLFSGIRSSWDRQSYAMGRLFLFTSGYSVLSTAVPVLVAAPRFIAGTITLGALMQTAQAFQQLAAALSWPIDNLQKVAEWRASVERVIKLQDALAKLGNGHGPEGAGIVVDHDNEDSLEFHHVSITSPEGTVLVADINEIITKGEKVQIAGDPLAAIYVFKVVAGLWPWGSGSVLMPQPWKIFFVPQRPYLPVGTLRDAIAYPRPRQELSATQSEETAMDRVGLGHLIPRLDESATWDTVLSQEEQQRLGLARLLIHRPSWVFIEEGTDALSPVAETSMMAMIMEELPESTVITIGHRPGLAAFHQRTIIVRERRHATRAPLSQGVKRRSG